MALQDRERLSAASKASAAVTAGARYGCSKGTADQYVIDYARTFGLPAVVFRMSCIYGPHQFGNEDQGWVAHFLIRALSGEPITLYGDGMQVRDILYVDDLVDAFLVAQANMPKIGGRAFNIGGGPGNTMSLLQLLDLIEEFDGVRPATRFGAWRPGDQRYYVSDVRRMADATGWRPRVGVRASNVPPWEGREWFTYPMPPGQLGHEGWGVVDAAGEGVTAFAPGDRVGLLSNHAYAEYDVAGEDQVVALPASLAGRPFPAEPLGCAMNIFARSDVRAGQTVAIVGIGFLGAILCRLAADAGARVIAIARRPFALNVARHMGAHELVPMDDHRKVIGRVAELTNGGGGYDVRGFCDRVIECTGKQWPLDLSAELCAVRAKLVVAGYHQDGPRQVNLQLWNWRGLDVINAHERDPKVYLDGMRVAVRAVSSGRLDPAPLYTHTFPLERVGDALDMTKQRPDGFVKALIAM